MAWFIPFVRHVAALNMSVIGFVLIPQGFGEDPGPIEAEKSCMYGQIFSALDVLEFSGDGFITSASGSTPFRALMAS